jgi:hypothetical protein
MRAAQLLKGPEPSQVLLEAEASVHTAEALALEQTRRNELQNFKRTNSEALANSVEAAHDKWQAAASAGGAGVECPRSGNRDTTRSCSSTRIPWMGNM